MEIGLLIAAFLVGFGASAVGLPPLVGYLVAGFVLHAVGFETTETIELISEGGVLLLLFGIGLKLRPSFLAGPEVWGPASAFAVTATLATGGLLLGLGALGLPLASELGVRSALIVGFALSFSSTVFAVKALEAANETASLSGRVAVGVLIIQDIFAVGFLVAVDGELPSLWALAVVPGFLLLRPVAGWLLDRSGHGEILLLLGFTLSLGVGAGAFDAVGLKPDLGALAAGFLLSRHPRAGEMADRLLAFKDILLVAFFLSIGLQGTPPAAAWVIGLLALSLLPLRSLGHFWLFTRFRLRVRTSVHASLNLSTYSEFGLIVATAALSADILEQAWVSTVAVAVAGSFVVASAAGSFRYQLYDRWSRHIIRFQREPTIEEDAIVDCSSARMLIFGMGRVGTGAYDEVLNRLGPVAIGVDRDAEVVARHRQAGRAVIHGDPLDRDFWDRVRFSPDVDLVVASTDSHVANLAVTARVAEFLPSARTAAIAGFPDQVAQLREAGVDVARNLFEEAGQGLVDDAIAVIFKDEAG